jgi:hypothetical protein
MKQTKWIWDYFTKDKIHSDCKGVFGDHFAKYINERGYEDIKILYFKDGKETEFLGKVIIKQKNEEIK